MKQEVVEEEETHKPSYNTATETVMEATLISHSHSQQSSVETLISHSQKSYVGDDRIVLSVGGEVFETSRQTLCTECNSMLAAWVLRHLPQRGGGGGIHLWIDRDAKRFGHVLNYLRNGTVWLDDVASLRAVQEEAEFFGLPGLRSLCEETIASIEAKEEARHRKNMETLQDLLIHSSALLEQRGNKCVFVPCEEVMAVLAGGGRRYRHIGGNNEYYHGDHVFQLDADF